MRKWTEEMTKYLKHTYGTLTDTEISIKMKHKFGKEITPQAISSKRRTLGLLKERQCIPRVYTPEVVEFIKSNYKGKDNIELAKLVNEKFNLNISHNAMQMFKSNYKRRYGIDLSSGINNGCIKKGNIPHNKGKKWDEYLTKEQQEKSKNTWYKKGNISLNNVPIGTERKNKQGYIEIKVRDGCLNDNWEYKQRYVYEQHYGKIPPKHKVIFADGNKYNFEIDNLILVSDGEEMKLNQYGLRSNNPEITKTGANLVKYICKMGKIKNGKSI